MLCKHTTTVELSLIDSTVYMVFPRQQLLFTETVPHNAYETVEGNQYENRKPVPGNAIRFHLVDKCKIY